jgi:tetratricopeptide (TPR) repeat protein
MSTPQENLDLARKSASENNHSSAIYYYGVYIQEAPNDSEVRKEYREFQREVFKGNKTPGKIRGGGLSGLLSSAKPIEAISTCEETLKKNPFNASVLFKLGTSALNGEFYDLAIYTFSDLVELGIEERDVLRSLGLAYHQAERYVNASKVFERFENLYDVKKETPEIQKIIRDAAALANIEERNSRGEDWTDREVEPGKTAELQREDEAPKTDEDRTHSIQKLEEIVNDPNSEDIDKFSAASKISNIYASVGDYDRAIEIRERVRDSDHTHESDKAIVRLKSKKMDGEIRNLSNRLGDGAEKEELERRITSAILNKWNFVVSSYGPLLQKYTNDPELHFGVGEGCLNIAQLSEEDQEENYMRALHELQWDFKGDERSRKAQLMIGECFLGLELPLVAEAHFSDIIERNPIEEDLLKALYGLGMAQKENGKVHEAIDSFGEILRINAFWKPSLFELVRKLSNQNSS